MHGLLDTNVFIYEVSAQKPSQLVFDGATELIHINWRQSIPQPGILLKYNCDGTLVVERKWHTLEWEPDLLHWTHYLDRIRINPLPLRPHCTLIVPNQIRSGSISIHFRR